MTREIMTPYSSADYLKTEEGIREYLQECFVENNLALSVKALQVATQACERIQLTLAPILTAMLEDNKTVREHVVSVLVYMAPLMTVEALHQKDKCP